MTTARKATATSRAAASRAAASPATSPATSAVGWPEELVVLYRSQYQALVRLAFLLTGSNALAEEIVQDAFIKVRGRLSQVERPAAYLRMAVVNGTRNHHRRLAVERRLGRAASGPAAVDDSVEELGDALTRLPERQRAVLVLRYYLAMSEADIAAALGCRPGTVKSLAHRGLAALREVIER